MSLAAVIGWCLAVTLFAVSIWVRQRRRLRARFTIRTGNPVRPEARAIISNASKVLVYIEEDGSARELTETKKSYLETEFSPFDGARPYVKASYEQRNGWGELGGFLPREKLPDNVAINATPAESTPEQTAQEVANSIRGLVRKHRPGDEHKLRLRANSA